MRLKMNALNILVDSFAWLEILNRSERGEIALSVIKQSNEVFTSVLNIVQTHATILLAIFNFVFILILFWDRWSDKPKLEIKMEDEAKIYSYMYALGFSVLNKGRKDTHNCSVSVQVFNRESGKKIKEDSRPLSSGFMPDSGPLSSVLMSGAMGSFTLHNILVLNGNFVARISAKTHKSKANKIVEYEIRNGHDPIIFKWGFVPYFRFHLKKCLLKKYRNEWDTEFLASGFKTFSDPEIRGKLIDELEKTSDGKAINPLIDRLENDPSSIVRDNAARVLGNIGDKKAVGPLLECLRKDRAEINWCTSAIAKIRDPECVEELIDILHNTDNPQKRRTVAKSLGEIGEKIRDGNIENALIEALARFDGNEFCDAVEALGKVGGEKTLKQLENMEQCCGDIFKNAIEQIRFRISVGGDNIEEK
jgi:hypothetical protein